ncbi:hypothetical protein NMR99_000161 [Vibrio navarrensis]|nr:hypothetical protein [Vibrio navarrensis]
MKNIVKRIFFVFVILNLISGCTSVPIGDQDVKVASFKQDETNNLEATKDLRGEKLPDAPVNDENTYIGDKISFALITKIKNLEDECSIPPSTNMRAIGLNDTGDLILFTEDSKIQCYESQFVSSDKPRTVIPAYQKLVVDKKDLVAMRRSGLTYGVLLVPYKYIVDAKEFKGGTSIGPYAGYRFSSGASGWGVKAVGFLGATTVDTKDSDSSALGVSYGVGLIGELKSEFQLGVVLGKDHVGKSENYEFNKDLWVAISIGYSFSN